jgi:hypothetical protein
MLKYGTIHVEYATILWHLKHVGNAIMIQIGSAMYHWIRLKTRTNYYYHYIFQFMRLLCQICRKHYVATKIGLPIPLRVKFIFPSCLANISMEITS